MIIQKLKNYLKRIYRLSLKPEAQENRVWEDLKKLHSHAGWYSGVYDKNKHIETVFSISQNTNIVFHHMIYDDGLHCRVKIIEHFPQELATDMFVLAAHLNNLLADGVVVINTNGNYVEFHQKKELLIPLLYSGEIQSMVVRHFTISKNIHAAFLRLVLEQEAPAIIIADMLKEELKSENESV